MDCLAFRRQLWSEPGRDGAEFEAHRAACAGCAAEYGRVHAFEQSLTEALEVPVPSDLEARIRARSWMPASPTRAPMRRFALAASLLLGIAVGGLATWQWQASRPDLLALDVALLEIIRGNEAPLTTEATVDPGEVGAVLAKLGARFDRDPGPVYHAKTCNIRGKDAVHLVLNGDAGRVTVFLLPSEATQADLPVNDGAFSGVIVPSGRGSLAVLGGPTEDLGRITASLKQQIAW